MAKGGRRQRIIHCFKKGTQKEIYFILASYLKNEKNIPDNLIKKENAEFNKFFDLYQFFIIITEIRMNYDVNKINFIYYSYF